MSVSPIKQAKEPMDPLSPARQALASARKVRAAASSIHESATAAQQRAERLLAAPAPLKAKLAELDREASAAVEAWARAGTGGSPDASGRRRPPTPRAAILAKPSACAEAARAAIPSLAADIAAAQSSASAAVDRMREAAAAILVEEADTMVTELIETERRAATLRGHLRALQHHFQLDAMRGNKGVVGFPDLIRKKVPERIVMTDPEIQRIAPKCTAYAERFLPTKRRRPTSHKRKHKCLSNMNLELKNAAQCSTASRKWQRAHPTALSIVPGMSPKPSAWKVSRPETRAAISA